MSSATAGIKPKETSSGPMPQWKAFQQKLAHITLSEAQRFLLLALLIGVFSGILVVLFHITIDFLTWTSLGALTGRFRYARLLSPALGAVVACFVVRRMFPRARGSGVNQTKMAIYTSDGYVSSSTIAGKFLACAISIGTVPSTRNGRSVDVTQASSHSLP